jgi:phosphatidylglycerophosphatase A
VAVAAIFFVIGGIAAGKMEQVYGQDPKEVTIDEVVGMWISLMFLPINWRMVLAAFLIFRVLDILKPYPADDFDKKPGGWNIMLDDVVAGLYTNLILQITYYYIPSIKL